MIDAAHLLIDLQRLLKKLEIDLRQRCLENPAIDEPARVEYNEAKSAERTSQAYEVWRDEFITQVAVSWILACVFVRFIEDNRMLDEAQRPRAWLSGPNDRLQIARDQHTLYFCEHPTDSDREYLEYVFREVAKYPGVSDLFDEQHNPLWSLGLSGDGATELLTFCQQVEPGTGELKYDFSDSEWNTRFLGDLYQDLSEAARKKYALLQTPIFVEEFILDRTLTPAINEFGYQTVRLIDPTCGSGHFLLGAFERLFGLWVRNEPGLNSRELAQRALQGVYGVDLNPFAVAIARFRLLIAALKASDTQRLHDAPAFEFNLAVGDSLLHGSRIITGVVSDMGATSRDLYRDQLQHYYETEDADELQRILQPSHYHAVVGNPPYVTAKDAALNKAYRERFGSCHMKYSLAVPFMERFFDLAIKGNNGERAGYIGMITSNSFMKREFGRKLIEEYIPRWNLTHVIDTAGAYIPGHATPTVVLFGRNQRPVAETIRTVMGIKGEPSTPSDPSRGRVWASILKSIDLPGTQDEFVSAADTTRSSFHRHPWSIGGGGAAELKEMLEEAAKKSLQEIVELIGVFGMTNADEAMLAMKKDFARSGVEQDLVRRVVTGEDVRDYLIAEGQYVLLPYRDEKLVNISQEKGLNRWLWRVRTTLGNRATFSKNTYFKEGRAWWAWHQIALERLRTPLSITFASVATHNQFVLDRGSKVFKQSTPIIKLPIGASENAHLALLGLLNSSVACFWMKQVFYPKGTTTGDISTEKGKPEANRYDFAATGMLTFPIPKDSEDSQSVAGIAQSIDLLAQDLVRVEPNNLIKQWAGTAQQKSLQSLLEEGKEAHDKFKRRMIVLQEELDWETYKYYGIADEGADAEVLRKNGLGANSEDRPFFWESDKSPTSLSSDLHATYLRRRTLISSVPYLSLLETPVFKRLWLGQQGVFGHTTSSYDERAKNELRSFLLDNLEESRYWLVEELTTTARLADRVRPDAEFMNVAEMYRARKDFDLAGLVAELVKAEAVPFLPVLRYKESGLRKRLQWEQTWALQRKEDEVRARIENEYKERLKKDGSSEESDLRVFEPKIRELVAQEVGEILVPPKYQSKDFQDQNFWRLRGKLDVPKERFISYPYCERDADPTLVIAWGGWDHLQQAKALASYYETVKTNEGWGPTRLVPLLAGILELLPWLMQWHNEVDPAYGIGMGDFFLGFVEEEARALGLTLNKIRQWSPVD